MGQQCSHQQHQQCFTSFRHNSLDSPNHIATLPTMYQEIGPMGSTNSFPEFINTATTNAQTHQEMTILESILPHSNGEYQNFIPSTISSSPMSYHNNLPISYDPTTNQSDPLQRSSQYYSTQCTGWGNESHRLKQEKQEQEAMNPTHISDSTKDCEETITSKKSFVESEICVGFIASCSCFS